MCTCWRSGASLDGNSVVRLFITVGQFVDNPLLLDEIEDRGVDELK